jgi:hypothetical protein
MLKQLQQGKQLSDLGPSLKLHLAPPQKSRPRRASIPESSGTSRSKSAQKISMSLRRWHVTPRKVLKGGCYNGHHETSGKSSLRTSTIWHLSILLYSCCQCRVLVVMHWWLLSSHLRLRSLFSASFYQIPAVQIFTGCLWIGSLRHYRCHFRGLVILISSSHGYSVTCHWHTVHDTVVQVLAQSCTIFFLSSLMPFFPSKYSDSLTYLSKPRP